jgi:protein-S-isoprenylcysteine O-methyltransferase Ste14
MEVFPMRNAAAFSITAASLFLGGGSLLAFLVFLYKGSWQAVSLSLPPAGALLLDAGLSFLFFAQHSGMIRGPVRRWMERHLSQAYTGAIYSIASGACLFAVLGLWQPAAVTVYSTEGFLAAGIRILFFLPFLGFLWSGLVLDILDPFGAKSIGVRLRRKEGPRPHLVMQGPYRWVRHPMYAGLLVLLWAAPVLTLDRLLFNLLWSGWVIAGAFMEEQGLVAAYGDAYRSYQRRVPMLIPVQLGKPGRPKSE